MEYTVLEGLKLIGLAVLKMWWLIVLPIAGMLIFYHKYLNVRFKNDRIYKISNLKHQSKKKAHIAKYAEYRKAM